MKTLLLINGPNLNLLGARETGIYGTERIEDIEATFLADCQAEGMTGIPMQSNHEGEIIDFIHTNRRADCIIINAGAFTHTSVALHDALKGVNTPFIEVHISNIHNREPFRHHSYLSSIAAGIIVGCGTFGYRLAFRHAVHLLSNTG